MPMSVDVYADRYEAGRLLADRLHVYRDRRDVIVLALPRGGVPVGHEVAAALGAPLDVLVVRKLGTPQQPELAMGAIASGGVRVLNPEVVAWCGVSAGDIDAVDRRERIELERREVLYREGRAPLDVEGRVVIVVDDGLATGSTMRAAVQCLRQRGPARIVVAVPVAAAETCRNLAREADEVVCARMPTPFEAVGLWYRDFSQTSDEEVRTLLREHGPARPSRLTQG
jgi:predicted phosphoribosyltransferase